VPPTPTDYSKDNLHVSPHDLLALKAEHEAASKLFEHYNLMAYTGALGPITGALVLLGVSFDKLRQDLHGMKAALVFCVGLVVLWSIITASTWARERDDVQSRIVKLEQGLGYRTRGISRGRGFAYSRAVLTIGTLLVALMCRLFQLEMAQYSQSDTVGLIALVVSVLAVATIAFYAWRHNRPADEEGNAGQNKDPTPVSDSAQPAPLEDDPDSG
jgi:hypothetical protein